MRGATARPAGAGSEQAAPAEAVAGAGAAGVPPGEEDAGPSQRCPLEATANEVIDKVQPCEHTRARRMHQFEFVKRLIRDCFRKSGQEVVVSLFGSVPVHMYLPHGDIDCTFYPVGGADEDFGNWADRLYKHMAEVQRRQREYPARDSSEPILQYVHVIPAEVHLVKCYLVPREEATSPPGRNAVVVDISYNQTGGVNAATFLEEMDRFVDAYHAVKKPSHAGETPEELLRRWEDQANPVRDCLLKKSIVLIKVWAYYEARILGATHSLISTYALEVMVVYVLLHFHHSATTPFSMFHTFVNTFKDFNWEQYALSIHGPVQRSQMSFGEQLMPQAIDPQAAPEPLIPTADLKVLLEKYNMKRPLDRKSPKHLNILDPLQMMNNLGRSVSNSSFMRIKSVMQHAANTISASWAGCKVTLFKTVFHTNFQCPLCHDMPAAHAAHGGRTAVPVSMFTADPLRYHPHWSFHGTPHAVASGARSGDARTPMSKKFPEHYQMLQTGIKQPVTHSSLSLQGGVCVFGDAANAHGMVSQRPLVTAGNPVPLLNGSSRGSTDTAGTADAAAAASEARPLRRVGTGPPAAANSALELEAVTDVRGSVVVSQVQFSGGDAPSWGVGDASARDRAPAAPRSQHEWPARSEGLRLASRVDGSSVSGVYTITTAATSLPHPRRQSCSDAGYYSDGARQVATGEPLTRALSAAAAHRNASSALTSVPDRSGPQGSSGSGATAVSDNGSSWGRVTRAADAGAAHSEQHAGNGSVDVGESAPEGVHAGVQRSVWGCAQTLQTGAEADGVAVQQAAVGGFPAVEHYALPRLCSLPGHATMVSVLNGGSVGAVEPVAMDPSSQLFLSHSGTLGGSAPSTPQATCVEAPRERGILQQVSLKALVQSLDAMRNHAAPAQGPGLLAGKYPPSMASDQCGRSQTLRSVDLKVALGRSTSTPLAAEEAWAGSGLSVVGSTAGTSGAVDAPPPSCSDKFLDAHDDLGSGSGEEDTMRTACSVAESDTPPAHLSGGVFPPAAAVGAHFVEAGLLRGTQSDPAAAAGYHGAPNGLVVVPGATALHMEHATVGVGRGGPGTGVALQPQDAAAFARSSGGGVLQAPGLEVRATPGHTRPHSADLSKQLAEEREFQCVTGAGAPFEYSQPYELTLRNMGLRTKPSRGGARLRSSSTGTARGGADAGHGAGREDWPPEDGTRFDDRDFPALSNGRGCAPGAAHGAHAGASWAGSAGGGWGPEAPVGAGRPDAQADLTASTSTAWGSGPGLRQRVPPMIKAQAARGRHDGPGADATEARGVDGVCSGPHRAGLRSGRGRGVGFVQASYREQAERLSDMDRLLGPTHSPHHSLPFKS